jgi:hypothetical protein
MLRSVLRVLFVVLAAASLSFATVFPARAVVKEYVDVSFTLTPDNCPDVATTISGSGQYYFRTNQKVMNDGSTHLIVNVTIAGTATDTEGNLYRFNYHNTLHGIAPAGASEVTFRATDHFNLVGAGGMNKVHVGFVSDVTFPGIGQGPPIGEVIINQRGTLSCDQI